LNRERWDAAGNWHTKLTQDFLALVLVNLHEVSLREVDGFTSLPGSAWALDCKRWTLQPMTVSCCNAQILSLATYIHMTPGTT
jgi:hypothetical protein